MRFSYYTVEYLNRGRGAADVELARGYCGGGILAVVKGYFLLVITRLHCHLREKVFLMLKPDTETYERSTKCLLTDSFERSVSDCLSCDRTIIPSP